MADYPVTPLTPELSEQEIIRRQKLQALIDAVEAGRIDGEIVLVLANLVPAGAWHTVEVLEPSVIFEAKDGKYGQDGSVTLAEYEEICLLARHESCENSTIFS